MGFKKVMTNKTTIPVLLLLAYTVTVHALGSDESVESGVCVVSPECPVWMSYSSRTSPSDEKLHDL